MYGPFSSFYNYHQLDLEISMAKFSKIIITGADGWLGFGLLSHLCELVKKPSTVFYKTKIVALIQHDESKNILFGFDVLPVIGDLRSESTIAALLKDAEGSLVFNLAGIIHPTIFGQRVFDEVNHRAMSNFALKCAERGVRKFVGMSSNSPCGYSKDTSCLFDEDSVYSPYMGYGRSKMLMEKSLLDMASSSSHTNFSIIRSPWFYGPFQPARQTEFFSLIKNGLFPLIGGGVGMRSMAYIDNLVHGLILTAEYFSSNGEIFWIADEEPYSMKDIVFTVKSLLENEFGLKVSSKQVYLPSAISDIARVADFMAQSLGLYVQKVHVLSEMNQTIACSVAKAKDVLEYKPEINLEEGMRRSIDWCLRNNRTI